MCVHGAIQSVVNPVCRSKVLEFDVAAAEVGVLKAAREARCQINSGKSIHDVWNNRPDWVRQDYLYRGLNRDNHNASWILGMVGLTTRFNDMESITFKMVQQKFREAHALALQLGV